MIEDTTIFSGGFAQPVFGAQTAFRALMDGMARPATIQTVEAEAAAPGGLPTAMAALALTLFDHDTAILLAPSLETGPFKAWLAFHTGAQTVTARLDADFALFDLASGFPEVEGFAIGSDEYPDRSTTLIIEIESLTGGHLLEAKGPGIKGSPQLSPLGLPKDFLEQRAANHLLFPRGIDLVLVSGNTFLCLPRTTRLSAVEA